MMTPREWATCLGALVLVALLAIAFLPPFGGV